MRHPLNDKCETSTDMLVWANLSAKFDDPFDWSEILPQSVILRKKNCRRVKGLNDYLLKGS